MNIISKGSKLEEHFTAAIDIIFKLYFYHSNKTKIQLNYLSLNCIHKEMTKSSCTAFNKCIL